MLAFIILQPRIERMQSRSARPVRIQKIGYSRHIIVEKLIREGCALIISLEPRILRCNTGKAPEKFLSLASRSVFYSLDASLVATVQL